MRRLPHRRPRVGDKRGSWYPFAPKGPERRDAGLEMQVRSAIVDDLRIESDLGRWFTVYGAPGL